MYIALYCDACIAVLRFLLLFIGNTPPPTLIFLHGQAAWSWRNFSNFPHPCFFFFFPSEHQFSKQRKWVLFIFCPSYWTVNLKKIPLQKIHSCSWRFIISDLLAGELTAEALRMALNHLKSDNIFTTAVLCVAVSPSALSVLWKKRGRKMFNSQLWDCSQLALIGRVLVPLFQRRRHRTNSLRIY